MNRPLSLSALCLGAAVSLTGCSPEQRGRFAAAETSLKLSRVVLYRNGVVGPQPEL